MDDDMTDATERIALICNQAAANEALSILERAIILIQDQGDDGGWALALFAEEIQRLKNAR
jgi:hypothetical protein